MVSRLKRDSTDYTRMVSVGIVDGNGNFIPDSQGALKILGASSEA